MEKSMASKKLRVILFGVGSIGAGIARVMAERPDFQIVGALDLDRAKIGSDLGQVIGLKREFGILVSDQMRKTLARRADLVMHATGSYFEQVRPQLEMIVGSGHNVVSTCEELADPWAQNARAADHLDRLAKKTGVSVLGTGINPGFAMDLLPVALTAACGQVDRVRVRRVVDASKRRVQLQKKIGTGLSPATFAEMAARREIRHVGLTESASLIARGLGWELDSIDESIEPVVAKRMAVTDYFTVEPGFVTGVYQIARGLKAGVERIHLELQMSVDAGESSDEAWIEGHPNLHSVVKGIHGDISTAAVAVNAARRIVEAAPGLLTMIDLPVVSAR
jgi:hypothetical protein